MGNALMKSLRETNTLRPVREMFCSDCERIEPHIVGFGKTIEDTEIRVEVVTVCIREYRFGGPCHKASRRILTVGSYNALVDNDYR